MPTPMPTALLNRVSRRLFLALAVLFALTIAIASWQGRALPGVVIATGIVGGFVGLQRRLKDLTQQDLDLIADSLVYTCLSPFVGGILALLLYTLFLSGLVSGEVFPKFVADAGASAEFGSLFQQHAQGGYPDYAKLVFWSLVSGYSEHFVTDVISRFEGTAIKSLPENGSVTSQQRQQARQE
jgi:hypothetical protein